MSGFNNAVIDMEKEADTIDIMKEVAREVLREELRPYVVLSARYGKDELQNDTIELECDVRLELNDKVISSANFTEIIVI